MTIELVPGLLPGAETLAGAVPLPWVIASARFTRGLAGAHDLVLAQSEALALARLVLGEEDGEGDVFAPEYQDALRETVNQMFSSASSSLRVFFGKPVGIATAELRQLEHADGWHPHVASIAVGVLTIDGVPRARAALTIPPSVRDEAASAHTSPVTVELGRTRMLIRDILALGPGSIIELDKLAGEPVDLLVNDRPIAKGEVVVIDENFGVRLTQIAHAAERLQSLS